MLRCMDVPSEQGGRASGKRNCVQNLEENTMWTDDERRAFEAEMIFDEKCATAIETLTTIGRF